MAGVLGLSVISGVILARVLGPSGRGEFAAITVAPPLIAYVAEMGGGAAVNYHHARHPGSGGVLIATWAALLVPISLAALAVGELVARTTVASYGPEASHLASLYALTIIAGLYSDLMVGVCLGDGDFTFYNVMRIVQPLAIIGVFLVLAMVRRLDVGSALAAYAGIGVCSLAAWSIRALRRYGLGRIDPSVGRATLLYGAKSHGATVGSLVSLRLDQVILPTIVSASALGLYAVAVSVTSVVTSIASALATVILPAAARNAHRGVTITLRGLRAALISALVLAVGLAFLCPLAIQVVYGSHYLGGVDAVRLLLPGSVALAGTAVVGQGLLALNKPLSAAASQLIGAAVTVVGLLLVFRFHGGIGGASIVSSVAYTAGLVAGVFLYARAAGLRPWFVFGVIPPGLHTEE